MRIQILPLPSVVVGEYTQEPFGLIVDQWSGNLNPHSSTETALTEEAFNTFAGACGAKAVLFVKDTVEVVDRYAEPAGFADREVARLEDFLTSQFPLPKGTPGPDDTPVDVAIRLLTDEVLRRDAAKAERFMVDLRGEPKPAEGEAP